MEDQMNAVLIEMLIRNLQKKGLIDELDMRNLEIRQLHCFNLAKGLTVMKSKEILMDKYCLGEKRIEDIIYYLDEKRVFHQREN